MHLERLDDDGFRDIARNLWGAKPSFFCDLRQDSKLFALRHNKIIRIGVDLKIEIFMSFFIFDGSHHVPFDRQLEGLACLPEQSLDFIKDSADARASFSNFITLARVTETHNPYFAFADTQAVGYMAALCILTLAETNKEVLIPILAALRLRGILLGQPLYFLTGDVTRNGEIDQLNKDFGNFRIDLVIAMAGVRNVSDEVRQKISDYLSVNADLHAARQKNLVSVSGFMKDTRETNTRIADNISTLLPKLFREFFGDPALASIAEVLDTGPQGYIEAFRDPDKIMAGLRMLDEKNYPHLGFSTFLPIYAVFGKGKPAPEPPRWQASDSIASMIARYTNN